MWDLSCFYTSIEKNYEECKMQIMSNGCNTFKVKFNSWQMLIVQKIWKNSLNHLSIMAKDWVACVWIYYNKCKMQPMNNSSNILKVMFQLMYTCW
jgi:hypothetical protein